MESLWRIELLGWLRAVPGDVNSHGGTGGVPPRSPASAPEPSARQAEASSRAIVRFRSQKSAALLAFLACHRHRSHPREALTELLWPESLPQSGRVNLRRELSSLRRQLEPPGVPAGTVLLADRATVRLNPAVVTTDAAEFETGLQAAALAQAGAQRLVRLTRAVELYRGELLPGSFEEWVLLERQRLAELYLQALEQMIEALEQQGDLQRAIQWARRGVGADPLREELQHALIRLLAEAGEHAAAQHQYQALERLLQREAGTTPSLGLRALIHALPYRERPEAPGEHDTLAPGAPAPLIRPRSLTAPAGTVTLLLLQPGAAPTSEAAVQGAWGEAAAAAGAALQQLRAVCREHDGSELPASADVVAIAFSRASDALTGALAGMRAAVSGKVQGGGGRGETVGGDTLLATPSPTRPAMALRTGEVKPGEELARSAVMQNTLQLLAAAHPGQILLSSSTAALLSPEAAPERELVDLGLYRLRPEAPPERLFQLVDPETTPLPLTPPQALSGHAGHLPFQFTRFFGREEEIAQLCALFAGESGRLITLTGPGGSGKTRLAIAAAARVQAWFPAGVWFVPLADLTDPALIPDQVLAVLQVPRSPSLAPMEQLIAIFSSPRFASGEAEGGAGQQGTLLLLDNLEHLIQDNPAGEPEALRLLQQLRERVPALALLVTSRRRLNLPGEREFPVGSLPVPTEGVGRRVWGVGSDKVVDAEPITRCAGTRLHPTPYTLTQFPSIALFVDRAQAARPEFQLTAGNAAAVSQLCVRLEGIPLAIELAAARVGALTPARMLERLSCPSTAAGSRLELLATRQRGIAARHRSLRAALDWSAQLLSPDLQRFFARLSVFRGGWTLEAAEVVCGAEGVEVLGRAPASTPDTLVYLEELRERSLIVAEENSAGSSGFEVWSSEGPDRTSNPELRFRMLEPLREYAAEQLSAEEREAVSRRHAEYYLAQAKAAAPWLRSARRDPWLRRLQRERDNLRAALGWCAKAVDSGWWLVVSPENTGSGAALPSSKLSTHHHPLSTAVELGLRLAGALGWFWYFQGAWSEGRNWLETFLALSAGRSPGADAGPENDGGQPRDSLACTGRAPAAVAARAKGVVGAGAMAWLQGELAAAHARIAEGLALWQRLGSRREEAFSQFLLGVIAGTQTDYAAARARLEESVAIARALPDRSLLVLALACLGHTVLLVGEGVLARACCEESLSLARQVGDRWLIAWSLRHVGQVTRMYSEYERTTAVYRECLSLFQELGDACGAASALENLAEVAHQQADYERAVPLYEQALTILRELGQQQSIAWNLERQGEVARCRGEFAAARALLEESRAIRQASGQTCGVAWSLLRLGRVALQETDLPVARRWLEESRATFEAQGDERGRAAVLHGLGLLAQAEGDAGGAVPLLRESLALRAALGEQRDIAEGLEGLAAALTGGEDAALAARLLGAADALRAALGAPLPPSEQPERDRRLGELRAALGGRAFTAASEAGRARPPAEALAAALSTPQSHPFDR